MAEKLPVDPCTLSTINSKEYPIFGTVLFYPCVKQSQFYCYFQWVPLGVTSLNQKIIIVIYLYIIGYFSDLRNVSSILASIPESEFKEDNLNTKLREMSKELKLPYSALMRALRVVLTAQRVRKLQSF